jgi:hypothetical protein
MRSFPLFAAAVYATGVLLIGNANSARADEPPPAADQQAHIAELVEQLGDVRYINREKASAELARIGMPAQRQLRAALDSPDAEVRFRARQILDTVLASNFERQLQAFLADADGSRGVTLPAWDEAREMLGDDRAARGLFVQMQRAERELLLAFDQAPKECAPQLARSVAGIQDVMRSVVGGRRAEPALGSVAAALLVGSHPDAPIDDQLYGQACALLHRPPFTSAMGNSELRPKMTKLLTRWIDKAGEKNWLGNYQAMMLGLMYALDQAREPAARILKDANVAGPQRGYALLVLGKLGGRDDVKLLEPLLDDRQVCLRGQVNNQMIEIQVRDVALAMLVHLTGQDLKEYGYGRAAEHPRYGYNLGTLNFSDDAARQKALAKWKAWRAAGN